MTSRIGRSVQLRWLCAVAAAFFGVLTAWLPVALAEAPPPFGQWASRTSTAQLHVQQDWCVFAGTNTVQGSCTWNPTSGGGILTIYYPMPVEPGKLYLNIVWVDQSTITVFGEPFYRQ